MRAAFAKLHRTAHGIGPTPPRFASVVRATPSGSGTAPDLALSPPTLSFCCRTVRTDRTVLLLLGFLCPDIGQSLSVRSGPGSVSLVRVVRYWSKGSVQKH